METIVCFGPGPKFKGGISNYNTSLAKALDRRDDCDVHIVSWTQQYPSIVPREFVDKTSRVDLLEGTDVKVAYITNYNNPLSWAETVRKIAALKPAKVIIQWAIAIQGLPLGYIARQLKKHGGIEVIFDLHFVVQKESSSLDRRLTRYGIAQADVFIAHAHKTVDELRELFPMRRFQVKLGKGASSVGSDHPDLTQARKAGEGSATADKGADLLEPRDQDTQAGIHVKPENDALDKGGGDDGSGQPLNPDSPDGRSSLKTPGAPQRAFTEVLKLYHPIYDIFKPDPDFDVPAYKREHGLKKHVFLFFGFIRKYKGLHNAIEAFAKLAEQRDDVSLIICGESFWDTLKEAKLSTKIKNATFGLAKKVFLAKSDDERDYRPLELLDHYNIRDRVLVRNEFVANEEVHKYFQTSDAVLLFYSYATPSGVESISYNFNLPGIATRVGHFPETITDGYNGYLAEPEDTDDMARQMARMIDRPIPGENIKATTQEMSWDNYAATIMRG